MRTSTLFSWLIALALLIPSAAAQERVRDYILVLQSPAVGKRLPARSRRAPIKNRREVGAMVDVARLVEAEQQPIRTAVAATGAKVLGAAQYTINAVFVRATAQQITQIRSLQGLRGIARARRYKYRASEAAELMRVLDAWNAIGGESNAGRGVFVAVLDSGVDHTHPSMRPDGFQMPAGFPKSLPEHRDYTNAKVVAARSYVGLLNSLDPVSSRPDDTTPSDRIGHGTAVAMLAAGQRAQSPTGELVGVAPAAYVGNYKIFGSPGINEFTTDCAIIAALDDAVRDGMNIINVSFGATALFSWDAGDDDGFALDPVAFSTQAAIDDFAVVIVAAAGNAGQFGEQSNPARSTIDTPASAPSVIAVGASANSREFVRQVRFSNQAFVAKAGSGPRPAAPLTLLATDAARVGDRFGCSAFPAGTFDGRIAVIERDNCDFETKVENADAAGARAVIITNRPGLGDPIFLDGLEGTDIPAFMISDTAGTELRRLLSIASDLQVVMDPTLRERGIESSQVAPFSSRGPSPDGNIKPEVVAPGLFLYAAAQRLDPTGDSFAPERFTSYSGTSFAAPLVSGTAALVWQGFPTFNIEQIRSTIIHNALPVGAPGGTTARIMSAGVGLVDTSLALDPIATFEPATLSFGNVETATFPITQPVFVQNTSGNTQTFRIEVLVDDADTRARVSVAGLTTITRTLAADELLEFDVQLDGQRPLPGEYEGFLRVQRLSDNAAMFVPFYYVVGDGQPFNSYALGGVGVTGSVGDPLVEVLSLRIVDRFGQPVPNLPITWSVREGGGAFFSSEAQTGPWGVALAEVDLGPTPGSNVFEARAAGLTIPFFNAARPLVDFGAAVNGASFDPNQPIAPGSIVSIFGGGLSDFTGSVQSLPMPLTLKHVSVSFDFPETNLSVAGRPFFSSPGQINVQVPWELQGLNFAQVKVRLEDRVSQVLEVPVQDAAPGIFQFADGGVQRAIVTHADGSLVTPQNPASRGETVILYVTGMGAVSEQQENGVPAPSDRLVFNTGATEVDVAGIPSNVTFSGLSPGFVGLSQINVVIPSNAPSGDQDLVVFANGAGSNVTRIAIR